MNVNSNHVSTYMSLNVTLRIIKENCRICLTNDNTSKLIAPCACKGSTEFIHENCLK